MKPEEILSRRDSGLGPAPRIVLDPTIEQPENVFTLTTYKEFVKREQLVLKEYKQTSRRLDLLRPSYDPSEDHREWLKKRRRYLDLPEYREGESIDWQLELLQNEYHARLPVYLLARCPYCGRRLLEQVDTFSLNGIDWHDVFYYRSGTGWNVSHTRRSHCKHAVTPTFSVNLNGLTPDDVFITRPLRLESDPVLLVWPLIARQTSAVLHALPVGRLDDPESMHRYTAYFVTYFAGDDTNLYTEEMWVPNDLGGPATGAVEIDDDLVKWVEAGRLFWLDPDDPEHPLVRGPVEAFPYADVQPKGWYTIVEGQVKGPHPYYRLWDGEPPPHDRSFPHTIEFE